jgi:5-methylcytosine-specific restriction endonuclease McrA
MGYKNYNQDMNTYMKNRWDRRRKAAVEHLGSKCARCPETESLEFDHIIPATKIMTVARASSRSEEFFWAEVNKCQLLCYPCHLEKTAEDYRNGLSKNPRKKDMGL